MIYGDKLEFWRAKVQANLPAPWTPGRDNLLCDNQERVHAAGFREAGVVETIFGYSVRLRSGLDGNQVLFGGRREGRYVSHAEAVQWGKAWVDASPDYRVLSYGEECTGHKSYGPCGLDWHKQQAVRP